MLFTRRPNPGRPRLTSRREDCHIVRNARVQPTAPSAAFQAQVVPLLAATVSSRTIRRRLAEGHFGSRHPLHVLPLMPTCEEIPLDLTLRTRMILSQRRTSSHFNE
ncbi:transposable element Tcb2 transposase [Trichonephila clavipes]|nr:transposable element Tcb2 transposase [Trichonephila clavipes]